MKRKPLFLAMVALLAAGGLWLARTAWRTQAFDRSSRAVGNSAPPSNSQPGQMLQPPDPNRRFRDLTPEERVQRARKGPIGG